jgi:hypothetical protein
MWRFPIVVSSGKSGHDTGFATRWGDEDTSDASPRIRMGEFDRPGNNKLKHCLAGLLALLAALTAAQAAEPRPRGTSGKPNPTLSSATGPEAFAFATVVVRTMELYTAAEMAESDEGKGLASLVNNLATLRLSEQSWRMARYSVEASRKSHDPLIRETADSLAFAYDRMAEIAHRRVSLAEAVVRGQADAPNVVIDTSKISADVETTMKLITAASIGVTFVLIDSKVDDLGHLSFLKITNEQRAELRKRLKAIVGPSPEDESRDEQRPMVQIPALLVWRWTQQPYRCR